MGLDEAMMVAGIGCRAGASARNIEAALSAALEGAPTWDLDAIATSVAKAHEGGIAEVARARAVEFIAVAQIELEAAAARAVTHSARVLALTGVPSVAEAAALAAAGPASRLLVPRVAIGGVTCALAVSGDTR
jgi:cobalt-precorrin 5A hydrolase